MKKYFKDSFAELQKVTWPDKETSLKMTIITIIFTAVITLLITLLDNGFNFGYEKLLDISPATFETVEPTIHSPSMSVEAETADGEPVELEVSTPGDENTES